MSCSDCFKGHVHDGEPQGKIIEVHGRQTYVASPVNSSKPKGIVVIIPDAFGMQFVNNKLLADHYAAKGDYTVYLPDFMNGTAAPVWMIDTMAKGFDKWGQTSALRQPYVLTLSK